MTSGSSSSQQPPQPSAAPEQQQQTQSNQQQQASNAIQAASPPSKRDLKSWWKGFKLPSKNQDTNETRPQGIFGVPLRQSITYANVAISLVDENGKSYIYGYVPIVVAKCGVFLKEKATGVEGIFRLSGSEKRIKELKTIFDSPDRYGKGLVWDGYTVHDAANVLRRYLNDLPEPVVPLDLYEKFREPLQGATKQPSGEGDGSLFLENFDMQAAIAKYQRLITELPPLNRQLLLYILDLLAVFAAKSDENRMNSQNLAAIFQPGILSHPHHAMAPEEYRLNQCVLIFLIENQDHFLIGMQGTAADENTVREVQTGAPVTNAAAPPAPTRTAGVVRSSSNASAGAESVAKEGKIRRNKSTSSRHSRHSNGAPSPGSPALTTTPTGGLGRSNTVPSKKSPALQSARFQTKGDRLGSPTTPLTPVTPTAAARAPPPPVVEEIFSPTEGPAGAAQQVPPSSAAPAGFLGPRVEPATPSKERNLQSLFQRSPTGDSDKRPPNKLRKKRLPGSNNPSAQSSTASLPPSAAVSPSAELTNPLEAIPSASAAITPSAENAGQSAASSEKPADPSTRNSQPPPPTSGAETTEHTLRPKMSPPTSLHSSFNEGSDMDAVDETAPAGEPPDKERKRRWRLSRRKDDPAHASNTSTSSALKSLGQHTIAEASVSTVGSSSHKPRQSFTLESSDVGQQVPTGGDMAGSSSFESGSKDGKEDSRGLTGWIKNKYREAKESAEQRRNKSPPADRPLPGSAAFAPSPTSLQQQQQQQENHARGGGGAEASDLALDEEKVNTQEVKTESQ
ncbi:hypothetical protein VTK73DRAFT_4422 [Phialemonium thermophilum]|uniref:Rho-GAP domain-containing protein n=1 Tax=Phialemonium thermophilum TaxID=223376 RepID=A0ABR3WTV8_9PEZI